MPKCYVTDISQCFNCPYGKCINNGPASRAEGDTLRMVMYDKEPVKRDDNFKENKRKYNAKYRQEHREQLLQRQREYRQKERNYLKDVFIKILADAGLIDEFLNKYGYSDIKQATLIRLRKFAKVKGVADERS